MATAGTDRRVLVWTTEPQQRITFLREHDLAAIWSVDFSPGGDHVVTACDDSTARIWDATTGRALLTLRHPAKLAIARFSPDGHRLATGADDGAVRIWDAGTGALIDTFTGHKGPVGALGWSPTGAELVSGAIDGSIRLWSVATGKPLLELSAHDGKAVVWAAFHPAQPGAFVTAGGDDRTVVWDAASGRPLSRIEGPRRRSDFDRTGRWLVSATLNRSATIWQLDGGAAPVRELLGHVGAVRTARFSPDDAFVVTASNDETARVWDREHGQLLAVLAHTDSWVNDAVFSPDGSRIATARGDGVAEIWQLPVLASSRQDFDEVVRCRAPYDIDGHNLVLRTHVPDDCRR
jgi:WD40 repeat protein